MKINKTLQHQAIANLKKEQLNTDTEVAHLFADSVLCALLDTLGYGEVVKEWKKVKRHYT